MAAPSEYGSIKFNLARLKNDNTEGHTQAALGRATTRRARETGQDIGLVRGRRRPTQRFDFESGTWKQV